MPDFHSWGSSSQPSRLPLTPPDYQSAYLTPMGTVSTDQAYYASQNYQQRQIAHGQNGREFIERYGHIPAYAAQQALAAQASHAQPRQDYPKSSSYLYDFPLISAPLLPPIRVQDQHDHLATQYAHAHPEPKQKEEKATGGVAAHLDYDMDLMAAFVAEMAQSIVTNSNKPSQQFRKYVSQILSSTRLPSSTIMLGLFYLASRMKILSKRGDDTSSSGTVYRMLTTSLLLGSKFLDDNTFQNRSWAEVSSIPVHELNTMELQWLEGFNWCIHGPMYDEDEGFFVWIDHWKDYEKKAMMAKAKEQQKLTPIDTTYYRSQSTQSDVLMSPEGPIPPRYQQAAWLSPYVSEYSPPSAPHSGPATPDYYSNWSYGQAAPPAYSRNSYSNPVATAYSTQRSQPPSYQPALSSYQTQQYAQSLWAGHGSSCGCNMCAKQSEFYFHQHGYPMQPVMG